MLVDTILQRHRHKRPLAPAGTPRLLLVAMTIGSPQASAGAAGHSGPPPGAWLRQWCYRRLQCDRPQHANGQSADSRARGRKRGKHESRTFLCRSLVLPHLLPSIRLVICRCQSCWLAWSVSVTLQVETPCRTAFLTRQHPPEGRV